MSIADNAGSAHTAAKPSKPSKDTSITTIVPQGLYRWGQIQHLMAVSRETWRQRMLAGRAPKPAIAEGQLTAWRGADLICWLENPAGYRAETHQVGHVDGTSPASTN